MTPVLVLSALVLIHNFSVILPAANARPVSSSSVTQVSIKSDGAHLGPSSDWSFLSQAEDVEREAWWIVTDRRGDGVSSPFRILRAASLQAQKNEKPSGRSASIPFKFCKRLQVILEDSKTWRVESLCQKPASEIGRMKLKQFSPPQWELKLRPQAFEEHFGLTTGILFREVICQLNLDEKGKLIKMACPGYVRDRAVGEVVQFKVLEYEAQGSPLLKIEGEVKKDLQTIATFKSDVPLAGDIVLKVKKIPQQKTVEEKTEFSDSQNPARGGGSNGKKDGEKSEDETSKENKENNNEESSAKKDGEEKSREVGDPEGFIREKGPQNSGGENAVPAIEEVPSPPSR